MKIDRSMFVIASLSAMVVGAVVGAMIIYLSVAQPVIVDRENLLEEARLVQEAKERAEKEQTRMDEELLAGKNEIIIECVEGIESASSDKERAKWIDRYISAVNKAYEGYEYMWGVDVKAYQVPKELCNRWYHVPVDSISLREGTISQEKHLVERMMLIRFEDVNGGSAIVPVRFICRVV